MIGTDANGLEGKYYQCASHFRTMIGDLVRMRGEQVYQLNNVSRDGASCACPAGQLRRAMGPGLLFSHVRSAQR